MISDIEHLFLYRLVICMSFWKISIQILCKFLNCFLLLLSCLSFFEIREHDSSSFVLLSQYCSNYLGSFIVLYKF